MPQTTLTAWPDVADLRSLLDNAAFPSATLPDTTLQQKLDAALADWEGATLYTPFLVDADAEPTTRRFDPPGCHLLSLRAGAVEIVEVRLGVGKDEPGDLLEEEEDYFLSPANATAEGRPYVEIEFLREPRGRPRSISVKAIFGYTRAVRLDAWEAVRQEAGARLIKETPDDKVIVEVQQEDHRQRFDEVGLMTPAFRAGEWHKVFKQTVARYRRKGI